MDFNQEKESSGSMEDDEKRSGVKSRAVVKYAAVPGPVDFARLQCNTDLNLPPADWLTGARDSYGLQRILRQGAGGSSFRMAHMFPDSVGEVDVISGAECIKTLLKLPYQPASTVSMMVHRVENTLLLDEFHTYDYLMKSEWAWLRNFFYDTILAGTSEQERVRTLELEQQGSSALQLTSKFLCHSVAAPAPAPTPAASPAAPVAAALLEQAVPIAGPHLPEPEVRAEQEPPHEYSRNVLWTFEDIQMLIGSDLPIFGGADRPCVSLRLRDANRPINVLTGIDYWLDNLMCNVPEVLMCYHIDGIVQKYEQMKTEDLPNLEGSKFSPGVVRNVAQNILSFLKANATKSGHTYWLFKGAHDDVVKLYDLTSLCGGLGASDGTDNPFTTPVAMLLYRVARRLAHRTRHVRLLLENAIKLLRAESHPQIVASSHYMLSNLYVPAATDPAAPHFKDESSDSDCDDVDFESELDPADGPSKEMNDEDDERVGDIGASDRCVREESTQVALKMRGLALHDIGKRIRPSSPEKSKPKASCGLGTSVLDRCGKALQHALLGLQALHNVTLDKCKEEEKERLLQQRLLEEQNPKMANPFEPIKMDYEPMHKKRDRSKSQLTQVAKEPPAKGRRRKRERKTSEKTANNLIESKSNIDKNAILIRKEYMIPTWHEPNRDDNFAWKSHLKTLLYEKICLAYATLAEFSYASEQYGFSLKYIGLAGKCQRLLSNMIIQSRVVAESCLVGRAGDNYFQMSKHWERRDQYRMQYETDHETDRLLRSEIERDLREEAGDVDTDGAVEPDLPLPESATESMQLSCDKYRLALSASDAVKRNELVRRLASVNNELGVRYMHLAQDAYLRYYQDVEESKEVTADNEKLAEHHELAGRSLRCLDEATELFRRVNDVPNLALLYCNKGRYMRFLAHCQLGGFSPERRRRYEEAESLYALALRSLGAREASGARDVWDLVCWELSSATYTRAALQQEHATDATGEAHEVIEALKKALKHCDMSPGPRQYLYQFRAAMIYHRLASLYHKQFRETREEGPRRRSVLALARSHYEQARELFSQLEDGGMALTVLLEHVAALEGQAAVSPSLKLKSLQSALQLLRESRSVVRLLETRDPDDEPRPAPEEKEDRNSLDNEHNLLGLYENRLQYILRSLIQHCRTRSSKEYDKMAAAYKAMYSASLKINKADDIREYARCVAEVVAVVNDIGTASGV